MATILNFGSINIDHVYGVDHFVRPGETISCGTYSKFPGGKGFNQSVALARAEANVAHAGLIGADGQWLKDMLSAEGADVSGIEVAQSGAPTGHAIIQVDASGQNCIVIQGGANREITAAYAEKALSKYGEGDMLLLQNEISAIPEIMEIADSRRIMTVLNPAPMNARVLDYPLELVSLFAVNEIEGAELAGIGGEENPDRILAALREKFPGAGILLTLGRRGAVASMGDERAFQEAFPVKAVDTTAAGDTFIGYFLALRAKGASLQEAMRSAARASSICVSRQGAAPSIPRLSDLA